jgi:hypothetical protein
VLGAQQAVSGLLSVQPPCSSENLPVVCPGAEATPATMRSAVCDTDDCVAATAGGMSALHALPPQV